jgi:hypothetical protein
MKPWVELVSYRHLYWATKNHLKSMIVSSGRTSHSSKIRSFVRIDIALYILEVGQRSVRTVLPPGYSVRLVRVILL